MDTDALKRHNNREFTHDLMMIYSRLDYSFLNLVSTYENKHTISSLRNDSYFYISFEFSFVD